MPFGSPSWLQNFHLDYYGGFARLWSKYETEYEGKQVPYWFNSKTKESTWDNPINILVAMIKKGVSTDSENTLKCWKPI